MKKMPTVISTCILMFAIPFGCLFFKVTTSNDLPSFASRILVALIMACSGGIVGGILGLFLHLIFMPTKTQRLLQKNNEILSKSLNKSKIEELKNLNILKSKGTITQDEFIKLKNEIINKC